MTRGILGTILWACLAACIGVGLFYVKHEVKDQEHRLTELTAEIQRNQETIHVLRAEWSYLNDPARLRELSEKHLGMHPVMPAQVATLEAVLHNGLPGGTLLASARPVAFPAPAPAARAATAPGPAPVPVARPADHPPVKLADNRPRPHPPEPVKPSTSKPPPARPGGVTLANAAPPQDHAASTATTPAHGGRFIVVQSPALAQTDGGSR